MNYREFGGFYSQFLRDMKLEPIDVIGFPAGGFIAAEMVAADPNIFSHMVLVAPMGIKPAQGEIMDFFAVTVRRHLKATVGDPANTPEFVKIYDGQMTPERFGAFEDARSETARSGWEPFMHNPSLRTCCAGSKLRRC
jgi:pimeloyl-ACP methyl ester carboxylesterase